MNAEDNVKPENLLDLAELSESVQLREGIEGITRALWDLYRGRARTTRDWSRHLHIPVPVLAALRRELEKREILQPGGGLVLTESGKDLLEKKFGRVEIPHLECPGCQGKGRILPPEAMDILDEFRSLCQKRPEADVTLDQSHATPETGISKALLLLEKGLLGQSIFFLGDDDLISVACLLIRKRFLSDPSSAGTLYVADVDKRYLDTIDSISEGDIKVQEYDARDELPKELMENFGVTVTDPAYTVNAVITFAYRCLSAANAEGTLFLSMPMQDTHSMGQIEYQLLEMGWTIQDVLHSFNHYVGASIHAHVSSLFVCGKWKTIAPDKSMQLRYTPFYTGEVRKPGGQYKCTLCESIVQVGENEMLTTIQHLKKEGCPECGNQSFHRLSRKEI